MISIRRRIANLNVVIEGPVSQFLARLDRELAIYPPAQQEVDILIHFGFEDTGRVLANNPAIHREFEDGFAADFGPALVRWHWGTSPVRVTWISPSQERSWRQKLRNIQYTHPYEQVGQVFFELVLIPTLQLFYHQHLLLLHGSALADNKTGAAMIFGGTGGVGKTSLELSMAGHGYDFMADDICLVDADGILHANFAWPKIYGYNTLNDKNIRERIFQNRSGMDKLFWGLRMRRLGGGKVRRRVDPAGFFNGAVRQQARLQTYYILFRDDGDTLSVRPIQAEDAVEMSLNILNAEYTILYRHLFWHQANRIGLSQEPFVTQAHLFESWRKLGLNILKDVKSYLVHVPMNTSATDLRAHFQQWVKMQ